MPKLSIIVPIYNAAPYLHRCIGSILSQSFTDFELLLIDDGSTDESSAICDEYAVKDARIRVFHKENGGVSSARNLGLDNALGEWIYFVDADDEVVSNGLMNLYEGTNYKVEIILGGFVEIDEAGQVADNIQYAHNSRMMCLNECLYSNYWNPGIEQSYSGYLWIWLYKNSIIQKNGLRFQQSISFKEDTLFTIQYICRGVKQGYYVDNAIYRYRTSETSICQSCKTSYNPKYNSSFDACEQMLIEMQNIRISDNALMGLGQSLLFNRYHMIKSKMMQYHMVNKKELKDYRSRVIKQIGYCTFYYQSMQRILGKGIRYIKRHILKTI